MNKFWDIIGSSIFLTIGVVVGYAAGQSFIDPPKPILSKHAVLAIMACNELKLENESVTTVFDSGKNTYTITSNCSNNVKIILSVPKDKIIVKET